MSNAKVPIDYVLVYKCRVCGENIMKTPIITEDLAVKLVNSAGDCGGFMGRPLSTIHNTYNHLAVADFVGCWKRALTDYEADVVGRKSYGIDSEEELNRRLRYESEGQE